LANEIFTEERLFQETIETSLMSKTNIGIINFYFNYEI